MNKQINILSNVSVSNDQNNEHNIKRKLLYKEISPIGYYMGKEKDISDTQKEAFINKFKHDMLYCPEKRGFKQLK